MAMFHQLTTSAGLQSALDAFPALGVYWNVEWQRLARTVLSSGGVVCLIASAAWGYALYIRTSAAHLVKDLSSLAVDQSSYSDVRALAHKYRYFVPKKPSGFPPSLVPGTCTPKDCLVVFNIDNSVLAKLHLADRALLSAGVQVVDARVTRIDVALWGGPKGVNAGILSYTEHCDPRFQREPYGFPATIGKPYLAVNLCPGVTVEQKSHAFEFSTQCLVHRGECGKPCDYLPSAWKDFEKTLDPQTLKFYAKQNINCD